MHRRACLYALAVFATSLAMSQAAFATRAGWRREPIPWTLIGISRDGRAVRISVGYGDCEERLRESVREYRRRVWIDVSVEVPQNRPGVACPVGLRLIDLKVRLRHPLHHRTLIGEHG